MALAEALSTLPDWPELLAANVIVAGAAALQVTSGLGFAMVAVPLLGLLSLGWLPGPMLASNILLSVVMLVRGRRALVLAEAPPLWLGLALGTALGALVLSVLDPRGLQLAIGLALVAAALVTLAAPAPSLTPARLFAGATAAGVTGIVAAMHGPPLVLLMHRAPVEKIRATMAGVFVVGCTLAIGALAATGRFGTAEAARAVGLLPGVVAGYLLGRQAAGRMPAGIARAIVIATAGCGGAALALRAA